MQDKETDLFKIYRKGKSTSVVEKIVIDEPEQQSNLQKAIIKHIAEAPSFLSVKANPWLFIGWLSDLQSLLSSF